MISDLGSLAGLYRTVFWMIGRKAQYGRIWPPEAVMGTEPPIVAQTPPEVTFEAPHAISVEAGARD